VSEVTRLLDALRGGDSNAEGELLSLVYTELRKMAATKMAREQPGHTLQPTALVHEAWLRLGDQRFDNRAHFFGAAAEAMRRILVETARRKHALRRGGGHAHVDLADLPIAMPEPDGEVLAMHEALDRLAEHDAQKAELVKLRYFAGLSIEETASVLGISERTAKRHWTFARAWLLDEMGRG
jgi:RNA polymerase sigma factor (TIGR02999 family)